MRTIFGNAQYFDFMLRNIALLKDTGDAAAKITAAQTYVERVEILNPYLTRVAPVADELTELIRSGRKTRSSTAVLKRQLLAALEAEDVTPRFQRDGKWLEAGRKFFVQYVMPLLISQLEQQLLKS